MAASSSEALLTGNNRRTAFTSWIYIVWLCSVSFVIGYIVRTLQLDTRCAIVGAGITTTDTTTTPITRVHNSNSTVVDCSCSCDDDNTSDDEPKPRMEGLSLQTSFDFSNWKRLAIVNRSDFIKKFDTGSPTEFHKYETATAASDPSSAAKNNNNNQVVILYENNSKEATHTNTHQQVLYSSLEDATEKCNELNVIQYEPSSSGGNSKKCLALVPGVPSYHIPRFVRIKDKNKDSSNTRLEDKPLELVPRGTEGSQLNYHRPSPPDDNQMKTASQWLADYLQSIDRVLKELNPIIAKVAINNTIVVMAANSGQADLMINFACSAHSRNLDIKHVVVFAMDPTIKELVQSLGMTPYYDGELFDAIPSQEPNKFGDGTYRKIAVSKFMIVHLTSLLGYDFLQQDLDIIWYQDPIKDFFLNPKLADPYWDIFFQDDMSSRRVFAPIRGNGGFFFVRSNRRTKAVIKDFATSTDMMQHTGSHQQTLIQRLVEHISLTGLRVKTFDGIDTDYFPSGKLFRSPKYIQQIKDGTKHPYIAHVCWTYTKEEKKERLQQLGEWHIHDQCYGDSFNVSAILSSSSSSAARNTRSDSFVEANNKSDDVNTTTTTIESTDQTQTTRKSQLLVAISNCCRAKA